MDEREVDVSLSMKAQALKHHIPPDDIYYTMTIFIEKMDMLIDEFYKADRGTYYQLFDDEELFAFARAICHLNELIEP